jgi:hypothetical protein
MYTHTFARVNEITRASMYKSYRHIYIADMYEVIHTYAIISIHICMYIDSRITKIEPTSLRDSAHAKPNTLESKRTYIHIHACTHICTYTSALDSLLQIYIYYIYTCAYIHTHVYIHMFTHMQTQMNIFIISHCP